MKYLILTAILFALPCQAQWKDDGTNLEVVAFGAHDTSFFVSGDHFLFRRTPPRQDADTGLDFTQGNFNTFASVGTAFLVGVYDDYDDSVHRPFSDHGVGALSTDNGDHWTSVIGGPVGDNGTYLFARHVHHLARSRDSAKTWEYLNDYPSPQTFAGQGELMYMTTSDYWSTTSSAGLWRSLDSGYTWTHMNAPFSGTLVQMRSVLFIYQHYRQHLDIDEPSRNGILIMSRDSGMSWDTVRFDSGGIPEYITTLATDSTHLFAGGHNALTGRGNGVYISSDTGKTWRAANQGLRDQLHIKAFGFFDTLVYMSASRDDEKFPFGTYTRSLRELLDTTHSRVIEAPTEVTNTMEVFPNPTMSTVSIVSEGSPIRSVVMLNVLGQEVRQEVVRSGAVVTLDLSRVASGTYYLRIETGSGTVMKKIVRE